MGQKIIYLVRHGHYHSTPLIEDQRPAADPLGGSLTDLGKEQADLVAQRLRQIPIDRLHYSTMRRAAETADIIAAEFPGVPLHASELLWEFYWKILTDAIHTWEGEALVRAERSKQRIATAFDHYFTPGDTEAVQREIVVCHGNLISYFVRRALQIPDATALAMETANCALSAVIVEDNGRLVLVSYNDVGHLPIAKQTYIRHVPLPTPLAETIRDGM